jgi:hypothetical protein
MLLQMPLHNPDHRLKLPRIVLELAYGCYVFFGFAPEQPQALGYSQNIAAEKMKLTWNGRLTICDG